MKTIERNYTKNPHTANFLMTFHTGGQGFPADLPDVADDAAALASEAAQDDDLLALIPADHVADHRSPRQADLMGSLIEQITNLDYVAGRQAREYTESMTGRGRWTAGREGNASAWIGRMIDKVKALKAAQPVATNTPAPAPDVEIPAGRYAVETDEIRCYSVSYGKTGTKWDGFLFLDRISSDDQFPIRNASEKARILEAIRADVAASELLAALTLRICRGTMKNGQPCRRTLSDTKNPYFAQGYGPTCGNQM